MDCNKCGSRVSGNVKFCNKCGNNLTMQNQNFQPNYKQGVNSGYVHSPRKLFRSRNDRIIAGVCGGLGTYLDLDTNLVRVLFVIFSIFYGGGIIIYIIMIMLIPESPYDPWLEPNTSKAY